MNRRAQAIERAGAVDRALTHLQEAERHTGFAINELAKVRGPVTDTAIIRDALAQLTKEVEQL